MATVWVPSLLRPLCDDAHTVEADGDTLRGVLDALDRRCPGIAARLIEAGGIRAGVAIWIDGEEADGVNAAVQPGSEIQIVPAISGG